MIAAATAHGNPCVKIIPQYPAGLTFRNPIAQRISCRKNSVMRSAEQSRRRKSTPFQSAMSMLNFYVNRMGRNLRPGRRRILQRAKSELRDLFGKREK